MIKGNFVVVTISAGLCNRRRRAFIYLSSLFISDRVNYTIIYTINYSHKFYKMFLVIFRNSNLGFEIQVFVYKTAVFNFGDVIFFQIFLLNVYEENITHKVQKVVYECFLHNISPI